MVDVLKVLDTQVAILQHLYPRLFKRILFIFLVDVLPVVLIEPYVVGMHGVNTSIGFSCEGVADKIISFLSSVRIQVSDSLFLAFLKLGRLPEEVLSMFFR